MSPERFKLVEEVFQAALLLDQDARRDYIISRCAADHDLRDRVFKLLDHHHSGGVEPLGSFAGALRSAAEAAMSLAAPGAHPTRIGAYRILRPLGEGGFGIVYLAEQDHPRRTVALKLLRTVFASGEIARRFEYEARILARLRHPGIAQIYEAGSAEVRVTDACGNVNLVRQPFLALEYVDGPNLVAFALGDGAARPPVPIRDRLALFALVCDALQHAHQNGVIHRDLKPDNILVACDRPPDDAADSHSDTSRLAHPKLLDFGVARVLDADPDLTRAHTVAGRMIGTLAYMSPEQIAGDGASVDTRSDVYAMGVILHQLLSGRLPYDVRDVPLDQALRMVRERDPSPIRSLDRALRADAHAVIQRAMAKDRQRRYHSMAELAADARHLLSSEPVSARGDSRWYVLAKTVRRHRVVLAVAAAFILLLASSSVIGWTLYADAQHARRNSATLLRESYLNEARAIRAAGGVGRRFAATDSLVKASNLRMDTDLRSEAVAALCMSDFRLLRTFPPGYASARGLSRVDRLALVGDDLTIRVVGLDTDRDLLRIPACDTIPLRVRFNPSGQFIGCLFVADNQTTISIWSMDSSEPIIRRTVSFAPAEFAFGMSNAKPWAALPQSDNTIELVALPSGDQIAALRAPADSSFMSASPDGSRLARLAPRGDRLEILDTATGQRLAAWSSKPVLRSPCWSPDARVIGACGDDRRVYRWDTATHQALPPLEGHRAAAAELAIGADLTATAGWDGTIRIWDTRTGAEIIAPLPGTELLGFDGNTVAVGGDHAIQVLTFVGDSPRLVLRAPGPLGAEATVDFSPRSPVMGIAGAGGVYLWDTQTWRSITLTTRSARNIMFPKSEDTVLALVDGDLQRWNLRSVWDPAAGTVTPETIWGTRRDAWASLHPDGSGVLVAERHQIIRVDLRSRAVTRLAPASPGIERPIIDPTGRWLFLGTWHADPARLTDLRDDTTVMDLGNVSARAVFSPDGSMLAIGLPGRHLVYDTGRWDSPREFLREESGLAKVAGAAAIAPGNTLFAYVEPPHAVRLAHPATGAIVATLPNAERYGIPDLRFSPDAHFLVVPTLEDTIIVWQMDKLRAALEELGMAW